ncbi:NAD-dependent protein deacetylase sirtuin-1 isoform X2 [Pseudomyrmex gracilis]|uniref:NAD-dependent protein deacetylase sirtuin-1 isoform X2 n=1 Tax=Pseudomyrmex gracilis TaxID=219809 RepID=UPI000995201B|nr:NAD-dependent protein deacetylase sirtuin-1 isoform X2 [Pseudomyrmex gracilis]
MASSSELLEYSSPAKRRKVEGVVDQGSAITALADSRPDKTTHDSSHDDPEETLGTDSGFNDLSDESKSASISPAATNLISPSSRVDSTSNDTECPVDTADEKDEVSSTVSNLSDLSGLSELSGEADASPPWRNASSWIQKQMLTGVDPRNLLHHLLTDSTQIPEQVDDFTLWKIIINMMSEPPRRHKLRHINTLSDVVRLIRCSKKIIVLTGAGVSVSCGIPDFRSRDGIYSRLAQDFPDLPDPQAMFDINYFSQDPRPFYKFAREIYPGQFKPSPCHRFIKMLDKQKKLLRNYSQNIDTLEQVAGIENVIECHGSFATASCTRCKYQVRADDIREDIFAQRIPTCPKCRVNALPSLSDCSENYRDLVSQGIMKPDIVFFGEGLPDAFHDAMAKDKDDCDLLIVIGSSLKVRPVALIPSSIPSNVPQILINREPLPHLKFDVELLGDGDIIINQICHLMGDTYKEVCWHEKVLKEAPQLLPYQCLSDDTWEQSQDTTTNTEMSRDSVEVDLKPHAVSSTESQDSLLITTSALPQHTEDLNVCVSPFYTGHVENVEESFNLLGESPKRRSGDTSIENSPKRMNFGSNDAEITSSTTLAKTNVDCSMMLPESNILAAEIKNNLEDCQVVPSVITSLTSEAVVSESVFELPKSLDNCDKSSKFDDIALADPAVETDKTTQKPRQASVDSVLDSGIGDSCNSIDSTEEKFAELKNGRLERHCWQPKIRESLAARLPENSYYQLAPGRYIFPGAEVYAEPEDFDRYSLSANSESTDSDSDSSSGEEEEDEEEETGADDDLSENADADADTDGQNADAKWASNSYGAQH